MCRTILLVLFAVKIPNSKTFSFKCIHAGWIGNVDIHMCINLSFVSDINVMTKKEYLSILSELSAQSSVFKYLNFNKNKRN